MELNGSNPWAETCRHVWREVLGQWLKWPSGRIESWIACWETDISSSEGAFFYHEMPFYYLVPLLISPDLREQVESSQHDPMRQLEAMRDLEERLFCAVEDHGDYYSDNKYDWTAAEERVRAVLEAYGSSMPGPGLVTDYERRVRGSR